MPKEILIIDDDEVLCKELAEFFEEEGMPVDYCCDTVQARTLLKRGAYTVVLLDYKMPREIGIEFLAANSDVVQGLKVFIMSGSLSINQLIQESGHGHLVSGIFCKPFLVEDVLDKIKTSISS